jgi:hypothetical protein
MMMMSRELDDDIIIHNFDSDEDESSLQSNSNNDLIAKAPASVADSQESKDAYSNDVTLSATVNANPADTASLPQQIEELTEEEKERERIENEENVLCIQNSSLYGTILSYLDTFMPYLSIQMPSFSSFESALVEKRSSKSSKTKIFILSGIISDHFWLAELKKARIELKLLIDWSLF